MKSKQSDIIVMATAKAKPGKEADLEKALREAAGPTREQPGCVQFSLHRPVAARSTIVGLERWASEADHQRHLEGAHIKKLMSRFDGILAEAPTIVSYEVVDE
jgi:quinol monooxygenase YgiN